MKKFLIVITILGICVPVFAGTNTFVKSSGGGISPSGPVTWTPSINGKAEIYSVTVHFVEQSTNEDIRLYLDSELGVTYDTVIATSDSVEQNDWFWQPTSPLIIQKDDNIRLWIDAGSGGENFSATIRGEYK